LRPGPPAKQKGQAGAGATFALRPTSFDPPIAKGVTDNAVPIESIVIRRTTNDGYILHFILVFCLLRDALANNQHFKI
jgi:hypothetical protein